MDSFAIMLNPRPAAGVAGHGRRPRRVPPHPCLLLRDRRLSELRWTCASALPEYNGAEGHQRAYGKECPGSRSHA